MSTSLLRQCFGLPKNRNRDRDERNPITVGKTVANQVNDRVWPNLLKHGQFTPLRWIDIASFVKGSRSQ
jgi:hypothetical protein